jgi:hypothetical protein
MKKELVKVKRKIQQAGGRVNDFLAGSPSRTPTVREVLG